MRCTPSHGLLVIHSATGLYRFWSARNVTKSPICPTGMRNRAHQDISQARLALALLSMDPAWPGIRISSSLLITLYRTVTPRRRQISPRFSMVDSGLPLPPESGSGVNVSTQASAALSLAATTATGALLARWWAVSWRSHSSSPSSAARSLKSVGLVLVSLNLGTMHRAPMADAAWRA